MLYAMCQKDQHSGTKAAFQIMLKLTSDATTYFKMYLSLEIHADIALH